MRVQLTILTILISSALALTCSLKKQIPTYSKCNPEWKYKLINGDEFCKSGVQSTICAMALAYFNKEVDEQVVTPGNLYDQITDTDFYKHGSPYQVKGGSFVI